MNRRQGRPRLIVPDEMAETLRRLRDQVPDSPGNRHCEESRRLDWALMTAHRAGWPNSALARALGVSRELVRQRVARAEPCGVTYRFPTPPPPASAKPEPAPPRFKRVDEQTAQRLRELHQLARKAIGPMRYGHPARLASEELSALLAELIEREYTVYHLAKVLGVTHRAVVVRLVRHGYRDPRGSTSNLQRYQGGTIQR